MADHPLARRACNGAGCYGRSRACPLFAVLRLLFTQEPTFEAKVSEPEVDPEATSASAALMSCVDGRKRNGRELANM